MIGDRKDLSPSLATLVRFKARQLANGPGFVAGDSEDVEQSLFVKLVQGLPGHDPTKGSVEAFAQTIVNRHSVSLVRQRHAAKRAPGRCVSMHLNIKVDDGEYTELAQTISDRELAARTGTNPLDVLRSVELGHDIDVVVSQIPQADRELFRRLKWRTVAQIARDMGVPPTTIHSRLRKYRHQFEDAGLREYL